MFEQRTAGVKIERARGERVLSHVTTTVDDRAPATGKRRSLAVACGAHALHDGFTDLIYVLLPLWQAEFGIGYAEIGMLRALYAGAMAGFQVPAGRLAERFDGRLLLAAGTMLAGAAYLIAGASSGFVALTVALGLGGLGSSVQHPIGSNLVAQVFEGKKSRDALASYNFSGDVGKIALPAATAWLVAVMSWRSATFVLGTLGLAVGMAVLLLQPRSCPSSAAVSTSTDNHREYASRGTSATQGFPLLLSIGVIDSATRMGFLTFLPFLLKAKGADLPTVGLSLTFIFAGGAAGKLFCGFLGARLGVIRTVFLTEALTAGGILILLPLPLNAALAVLPVIGMALNGTSSVLYGTVPELVAPERRARAFSLFYTGTIGAGALSPTASGFISDIAGLTTMMTAVAVVVLMTLPLAWQLRPALRS